MLKLDVLIIEDDSQIPKQIETKLGEDDYRFRSVGFIEFEELEDINPDIVILDIMQGLPADEDYPGKQLHDTIWDKQLFPMVVFSANIQNADVKTQNHFFIKYVQKGRSGLEELSKCVMECAKELKLIKEVKKYVSKECANVLKYTVPEILNDANLSSEEKNEILLRMTRRRLAAGMDHPIQGEENIQSWEQYIYPPIGDDVKMGDILEKIEGNIKKYVLVLTPSCDLDTGKGGEPRKPKVENLLVARCESIDKTFLEKCSIAIKKVQIKEKLLDENKVDNKKYIALPAIKNCGDFKNMVACMKKLELVPINEVLGEQKKYSRILSVDSPFRESIAWIYMQDACRPGLPDRNLDKWSAEIENECQIN